MFDAVRNNKTIVKVFLFIIILPFAFWGVESYVRNVGGDNDVASVGSSKISPREFQEALQEQGNRMRNAMGSQFKQELLDSPQVRQSVIDGLIVQRLLLLQASDARLGASDDQLRSMIASIPALQENGQFSKERYVAALAAQGLNQPSFEARLRQDMILQQIGATVSGSALVSKVAADRWLTLQKEEREVSDFAIRPDTFLAQVKLDGDAAQKYYDANKKQFEVPEQVRVDYLVLNFGAPAEKAAPTEAEIKAWFDSNAERYRQGEQRRASHILFTVAKDAPEAEVKAVQAKAEEVLKQVKQAPGDFAKLAKRYSKDPGSAANGGDLGFFGRGAMVKAFEDSAFSLKEGQTSELVRSDFGFHIIRVTGAKADKVPTLDEVRADIVAELQHKGAVRKDAEIAEAFSNLVEDQADSLAPAAEKFQLKLQSGGWISKGAPVSGVLNNDKLLAALFSDDAIKAKRNTRALEVAPNTMVAARVAEYKPAALRPFAEVKADIEKRLSLEQAGKLAQKDGEAKLEKLKKGEKLDLTWAAAHALTRSTAAGLPPETLRDLFKQPADKLPGYVGLAAPNGSYVLFKISGVKQMVGDEARDKALRDQYAQFSAQGDLAAYLAALRLRYPVKINKTLLEAKDSRQ